MAGVYRPRYPERTVLYRVLLHYFNRFLAEYGAALFLGERGIRYYGLYANAHSS